MQTTSQASTTPTLWHCHNARSLRPLWALEEMGLDYRVHVLPFPPRVHDKEFLKMNVLGTVPYFVDGETTMTESSAICQYLVERYQQYDFGLAADHGGYGEYLNWLYQSDATLAFPLTLVLRYGKLEQGDRRQPQVVADYSKWYIARLRRLDAHILDREYLCDGRFTVADIAVGYALYLGELQGLADRYTPQVKAYLKRLKRRDGFRRAVVIGQDASADSPG